MEVSETTREIGGAGVTILVVVAAIVLLWKTYLEPRMKSAAAAAGKLSAEKELEAFRGETARALEDHKAALSLQADAVKTQFQKQITDYSIYVQRRHDAVRHLYARVIECRKRVAGMRDPVRAWEELAKLTEEYQEAILYLPESVNGQFESVVGHLEVYCNALQDSNDTELRKGAHMRLQHSIMTLSEVCRAELQSSAA